MLRLLLFTLLPSLAVSSKISAYKQVAAVQNPVYSCDDQATNNAYIYCYGKLLEAVNFHELYPDSKTFVDMPMVNDPNVTMAAFNQTFPGDIDSIDSKALQDFVDKYFTAPGTELDVCTPSDWQEYPPKLMTISDPDLKNWALQLNGIWKILCRKMNEKVMKDLDKYSIIYVPYNFIIPGGRFREFYYWDAYWIIKGLLVCDMTESVKSMILNLANMVDKFGFVPNGGRVYYTKRSQPPLLSGMVYDYYEATQDLDFVTKMLPTLEKEFTFWKTQRQMPVTVNGKTYQVYRYHSPTNMPRAESYDLDVIKAENVSDPSTFYNHVASAAESGWDFSSRWFADKSTFQDIETTNIAPIDLNSFICWNMDIMEFLYEQTGNFTQANDYRTNRAEFRDIVTNVFYNSTDGTWYDYNIRTQKHNLGFYPATAVPLFTNCYNTLDQVKSEKLYVFMQNNHVFEYPSGIPTSMLNGSTEQWDFPNGWSPLNHMIIEGLRKSQNPQMQDQAFSIAQKWVMGNYRVWKETGHMYEKYNVIGTYPQPGSGGEYNVQDGFGWTNGAILDLLYTYNDRIKNTGEPVDQPKSSRPLAILPLLPMFLLNSFM